MNAKIAVTRILFFLIIVSTNFYLSSCSDDSNPSAPIVTVIPEPDMSAYFHLDSGYVTGASAYLKLYADDSLRTGYNKLYFVLHDSATGVLMSDAHITIMPLNHGNASPVENPEEDAPNGIFEGAMVFTQAFSDNPLHWHLTISVHNHEAQGEPEGEIEFETPVILENPGKFKSITMPDSTALYLSFISPEAPVTGLNDFEFLISKNEPQLYPPDGSYTVTVRPEYLFNGHTTENNVNPAGSSNGHYNGKINLDVPGAWRIKLNIAKNGSSYDTYFDVNY